MTGMCLLVAGILVTPMVVSAVEPINGVLTCDSDTIPVSIQGNGVAFRVTDATTEYVVKCGVRDDGVVIVKSEGQQDKILLNVRLHHHVSRIAIFSKASSHREAGFQPVTISG